MTRPEHHWWPLAPGAALRPGRPLARTLLGLPIVLFRDAEGRAVALPDRCPHRHAPLSAGRVVGGEIECPYHGWRFDGQGRCTRVPGLDDDPCQGRAPLSPACAVTEAAGLVWACLAPLPGGPGPTLPAHHDLPQDVFFMDHEVACGVAEAAENFLDGFHTPFVHAGWIRHDSRRQHITASVHRLGDTGVEARYRDEGRQSGLISRWLERERAESFGRFRLPGLAEIEYRDRRGPTLVVSAWLMPSGQPGPLGPDRLRLQARIATRRGWLPAGFKALVLRRLFGVILRQDQRILEATAAGSARYARAAGALPGLPAGWMAPQRSTPLDLLGPAIRRLLAGEPLDADVEREIRARL